MPLTPAAEIVVQVYFKDGTSEAMRFDSLIEAYEQVCGEYPSIGYVLEVEETAHGIWKGFDRTEEFETLWLEREREDRADEWHSDKPDWSLAEHLSFAEGPPWRKPSVRQRDRLTINSETITVERGGFDLRRQQAAE